ncbi:MAG: PBP1A family penicillin-binding protein [Synergistales bacterium]|nr:PBP1A family penicillin-binding protein [Synergistales bacterium]
MLVLVALAIAVTSIGGAILISRLAEELPPDDEILSYRSNEASVVYDRNGKIITKLYLENRRPEELKDISRWMIMSTLAAEDSSFYAHMGIRPLAILRSIFTGSGGQGASTITQQLARNVFLTHEKTMVRKAKEAILSFRIEKLFSKDKILETYLNAIYFGHGAWGIGAAAYTYFGKRASDLTLTESSILAGLIAAPEKYSPIRSMDKARARQRYVLSRMVSLGWISEEQRSEAEKEELLINKQTKKNILNINNAPYFVSHILFKDLLPKYGRDRVYASGLQIYTTLDLDLQEAAERAIQKLESQGAIVAMDPGTGEILALVGGKDFEKSKFNRATQAYRQPGSSFKPIVFTAALEAGFMPTDHILDKPITYEMKESVEKTWSPGNYSKKFAGEIPLFEALTHSYNTPAVRLTDLVGPEQVVSMARKLGITSPHLWAALSIGLGTASVTPLEMTAAYCAYANDGKKVTPYAIREIKDGEGKILERHGPQVSQAIDPSYSIVMRSLLMDVVRAGTGTKAAMKDYEVFGKTGTTNDYSDAWFTGGIPGLVTVVYAGNDDHKPLGRAATGGRIALPVWSEFMKEAVSMRTYPSKFLVSEGMDVVKLRVCRQSGYVASGGCKAAELYLLASRAPEAVCPLHGGSSLTAMEDPNAPRLLLLPQDEALAQGSLVVPAQTVPIHPVQPQVQTAPTPPTVDPYTLEADSPEAVEDRYQDLLRRYGLSD